jgi:hypothetical protein
MRALLVIDLRDWRGPASPGAERAERAFRHRMAEAINSAANSIQLGAPAGTITREGVVGHFVSNHRANRPPTPPRRTRRNPEET